MQRHRKTTNEPARGLRSTGRAASAAPLHDVFPTGEMRGKAGVRKDVES